MLCRKDRNPDRQYLLKVRVKQVTLPQFLATATSGQPHWVAPIEEQSIWNIEARVERLRILRGPTDHRFPQKETTSAYIPLGGCRVAVRPNFAFPPGAKRTPPLTLRLAKVYYWSELHTLQSFRLG